MDELDVIPPFVLLALVFKFGVQARLSEVFADNLFTFDGCSVGDSVVGGTVFTT